MAIAHVGTDSSGDSSSAPATLTVSAPTGVSLDATHQLILAVGSGATISVGSYTPPAGWASVGSVVDANTGADHVTGQVFRAAGNVANFGFTKSGTVGTVGWIMLAYSGVDTTTPIDATGTANSGTGAATLVTNAVTVVTDQAWHLIGFFDWLGGTFSAPSFTNAEGPTANETSAVLYNTTPKSVGSTGTVTVTSSAGTAGQVLVGVPFALRPAAGAAAAGTVAQGNYQWRNDDGDERTATSAAAPGAQAVFRAGVPARLREQIVATGDPAAKRIRWRYRKVGDVSFRSLTPPS